MLIRRQTTNLLQIFCEILLYFQVLFKSMKAADDISRGTRECEWVNFESDSYKRLTFWRNLLVTLAVTVTL